MYGLCEVLAGVLCRGRLGIDTSMRDLLSSSVLRIPSFLSSFINPLNAELNPICHLLALLGGATIVVVSRLRVKHRFFITYERAGRGER